MSLASSLRGPRGLGLRVPGLVGPELVLAGLADWLFWHRAVGLSLPLFCAAAALAAAILRPGRPAGARRLLAAVLLLGALAPAAYRLTALSTAFAILGTLEALRLDALHEDARREAGGRLDRLRVTARAILAGPRQAVVDLVRRRRLLDRLSERRRGPRVGRFARGLAWVAPVILVALFTSLLVSANPLIAGWLAGLPVPSLDDVLAFLPRPLFWAAVLLKLWPLVRQRRRAHRPPRPAPHRADTRELEHLATLLLSPAAVLRALVLLDLLLALQLGLDGAYLWGGVALPGGMTYAAYAHRGAYPLVATALAAGAVALLIRRPGAPPPSRVAAALLLLFLGENVLLVVSAIERLALYVAAYALTEWRVAAFAWMGLVAFGLASIGVAGALGWSARALLRTNALAALAVLYGWCFLDAPRLVADYDVAHCAELKGEGPALDRSLMIALGPDALPAVDRYLLGFVDPGQRYALTGWRDRWAREVRAGMADWRSWSLAGWRLARYLDTSGVAEPAIAPAGDDGS